MKRPGTGKIGQRVDDVLHFRERWGHRLRLFRIYSENNGTLMAKGIAFSLLFGSIPLLFLLVSLRSVIFFPEFMAILEGQLLEFLPDEIKNQVVEVIIGEAYRFSSFDLVTLGAFLIAVNSLFTDLGTGMATMLSAPVVKNWLHRVFAVPLMAAFLLLFYFASLLTPAVNLFRQFFVLPSQISMLLARLITIGMYSLLMTGLYYLFAGRRLRFLPTFFIAALSAAAWQGLNILSGFIVLGLGGRLLILGAVASVMIVLFYMRILADIFLISSVLVRIYSIPHGIAETEAAMEHRFSPVRLWRYLTAGVGPGDEDDEKNDEKGGGESGHTSD